MKLVLQPVTRCCSMPGNLDFHMAEVLPQMGTELIFQLPARK